MSVTIERPDAPRTSRRGDWPVSTAGVWPGMRAEYSWLPPHGQVTVTKPDQIGVSFTDHTGVVQERDGRGVELDIAAGAVFATGRQRVTWANVREPSEVVEIYPELELLRAAGASSQAREIELEPVSGARDVTVLGIAAVLKRALVHGSYLGDVHASTLAHRLAEHLATTYCRLGPARRRVPGRLDRVLLGTRLSAAEVAYPVGFSNLSHFRRIFRRYTGFAPSDLRSR